MGDTDAHPWHHPLSPPPALRSTPGLAAAAPHLCLASVQHPEPAAPHLCSWSSFSSSPRPSQTWGWGLGGWGKVSPLFLPTSIFFPPPEAKRDFAGKRWWSFSPSLSVCLSSEFSPSPSSNHEICWAGSFCLPHPHITGASPGPCVGALGVRTGSSALSREPVSRSDQTRQRRARPQQMGEPPAGAELNNLGNKQRDQGEERAGRQQAQRGERHFPRQLRGPIKLSASVGTATPTPDLLPATATAPRVSSPSLRGIAVPK